MVYTGRIWSLMLFWFTMCYWFVLGSKNSYYILYRLKSTNVNRRFVHGWLTLFYNWILFLSHQCINLFVFNLVQGSRTLWMGRWSSRIYIHSIYGHRKKGQPREHADKPTPAMIAGNYGKNHWENWRFHAMLRVDGTESAHASPP